MGGELPPYADGLIAGFLAGQVGRFMHLGAWDAPPAAEALSQPGCFEQAQSRLNDRLLDMAVLADGQRIADIGCGLGGTLQAIQSRHHGLQLAGVNIDPRQLRLCQGIVPRQGNHLHWVLADACALPLASASVDRVLCIEAMFHFGSRRSFFREAARLLVPGGSLVGSDIVPAPATGPAAVSWAEPRLRALAADVLAGFGPWPDLRGRDADHGQLAAAAGLRCVAEIDVTPDTLPSHHFTARADVAPQDVVGRAAAALAWLLRQGQLRYWLFRYDKT